MKKQKILITGSHGLIGGILADALRKSNYILVLLDKANPENPVDILQDDIAKYFVDVNAVIHLAANPSPFIGEEEARKNVEIARKVIEACDKSEKLERIINASSINVYPYLELYELYDKGVRLTNKTGLLLNTRWGKGEYGKAKREVERLFEEYCRANNISLINLRIGCVTRDDLPPKQEDGHVETIDYEIHLKHQDLIKIVRQGLTYKGIGGYVCVSKKDGFVDGSVRFPIN